MQPRELLRFAVPLALQLAVLGAIPAGQLWIRATGQTVRLRTAPVDPYDIFSGYYMTLSYEISSQGNLPGLEKLKLERGDSLYVLLAPGADQVWKAVSVHKDKPPVPPGQAVIRGRYGGWRSVEYGIEAYYIPEEVRQEMAGVFRENRNSAIVEVKVSSSGTAAIERIHAGGRTYEY